jgi:hypothetical protein
MPIKLRIAAAAALLTTTAACTTMGPPADTPAYFTEVTDEGWRYAHNWNDHPCFTFDLLGSTWRLALSDEDRVDWKRADTSMSVYFTDNRKTGFAVAGMNPEQVLRAFLGYEIEYLKPLFTWQVVRPPKFTTEYDGTWMAWGWEGKGGKRRGVTSMAPSDQSHVVISLWLDPWVMSFDWATTDPDGPKEPTLEMIMTLESLTFYPECFRARKAGGKGGWDMDSGRSVGDPPPPGAEGYQSDSGASPAPNATAPAAGSPTPDPTGTTPESYGSQPAPAAGTAADYYDTSIVTEDIAIDPARSPDGHTPVGTVQTSTTPAGAVPETRPMRPHKY